MPLMNRPSLPTPFGGRWVLVSGASSGIGRAIAVGLAAHGGAVTLTGRTLEKLQEFTAAAARTGRGTSRCASIAVLAACLPEVIERHEATRIS